LQWQCPRTRLPDVCTGSDGSIFYHPFLVSRLAGEGKLLDHVFADAEEDLVGSLPRECRMGHNLEASLPPIVGRDVAPDESPKSGHAVQGNAGRATSALEIARNPRSLNSQMASWIRSS
jgi:hypothetical protein